MAIKMVVSLVLFGTISTVLGKSASCSSPIPDTSKADAGECLLASSSRVATLSRASSSVGVSLSVTLGLHRAWRIEHEQKRKTANETKSTLDTFIDLQTSSSDACSSRLKESKRVLDGLHRDLTAVQDQFLSHEELLKTETENLHIAQKSIDAAEDTYKDEVDECNKQRQEAASDFDMYSKELEELRQIANPSIRYDHSIKVKIPEADEFPGYNAAENVSKESLLQDGVFSLSSCQAFKAFSLHSRVSSAARAKNLTCDEQREELQTVFTETWLTVDKLIKDAQERTEDTSCYDAAKAKRAAALVPLISQREQASARIEHSSQALALLDPILDMLESRVEKLQKHIDKTLVPECKEANKVQSSLNTVRDLIISLEKCPGRNDFMLKIPKVATEDEGPPSTNAPPTPPEDSEESALQKMASTKSAKVTLPMMAGKSSSLNETDKSQAYKAQTPKVMNAETHQASKLIMTDTQQAEKTQASKVTKAETRHHHHHRHGHEHAHGEVQEHGEVRVINDDKKEEEKASATDDATKQAEKGKEDKEDKEDKDGKISITVESTSV